VSYTNELSTLAPRAATTTEDLIRRYQLTGDERAREQAISNLMLLAYSVCRRYERRGVEWDDLVQVASLGLIKAIERFDPERGMAVSSYVVPTIAGEIKRHFRDKTWAVRPPRGLQERSLLVSGAASKLAAAHGRSPSPTVIAEHVGLSEEDVVEALIANRSYDGLSLETPTSSGGGEITTIGESIGAPDDELDRVDDRATIDALLSVLPARDRKVLRLRFDDDLTQSEIGARIGVSQMQVSRIIRQALRALRQDIENRGHEDAA
jgi:RNA polymerase sigma-B factor